MLLVLGLHRKVRLLRRHMSHALLEPHALLLHLQWLLRLLHQLFQVCSRLQRHLCLVLLLSQLMGLVTQTGNARRATR